MNENALWVLFAHNHHRIVQLAAEVFYTDAKEKNRWLTFPNDDVTNAQHAGEMKQAFELIEKKPGKITFIDLMMKKASRDDVSCLIFEAGLKFLLDSEKKTLPSWEKLTNMFPRFYPQPEKHEKMKSKKFSATTTSHHAAYAMAESTLYLHCYSKEYSLLTPLSMVNVGDVKIVKELKGEYPIMKENEALVDTLFTNRPAQEQEELKAMVKKLWHRTKRMAEMRPQKMDLKIATMTHTELLEKYKEHVAEYVYEATKDCTPIEKMK